MVNFTKEVKKEEETRGPEVERIEKEGIPEVPSKVEVAKEKEEVLRRKAPEEEREALKEKLEKIELPKEEKLEVLKEADRMREMQLEGKLNRLLDLAKTQSVPFAVKTAEQMNDACLLDLFHDKLIEKGLHKEPE